MTATWARRRFRPRFWPTLATLLALAVLIGLGSWQLQRLAWKNALVAERTARLAEPARAPGADWEPAAWEGRRVLLDGAFLDAEPLWLGPTSYRQKPGYRLFAAFGAADGRSYWVERGFAPADRQPDPATTRQPPAPARLEAVVARGGWGGLEIFRPANRPDAEQWLWPDLAAMAAARDLPAPVETGVFLVETPAPPGLESLHLAADLPNNHLNYALTWYGIALTLAGVYIAFSLERQNP